MTQDDREVGALLAQARHAEAELNRLQNDFLDMAGHEFRTPLTVIDTAAHRLNRKAGSFDVADIQAKTETIRNTVTRLVELVDRTFEIARLTTTGFVLHPSACSFRRLLETACAGQALFTPHVEVSLDVSNCPDALVGDGRFIDAVLEKLLRSTASTIIDGGRLDVSSWSEGSDVYLSLKCQSGTFGDCRPELLKSQLDASVTAKRLLDEGMEFKLAIFLIEMHQGELEFVSEGEDGFEIEVRLPSNLQPDASTLDATPKKNLPEAGKEWSL